LHRFLRKRRLELFGNLVVGCAAACLLTMALFVPCEAQDAPSAVQAPQSSERQLDVNWLYGAYVPKDVPLKSLTGKQRLTLYSRQSFTTPGIYVKTLFFSFGDQINNSPPDWRRNFGGFARRFGSRQGQFVVQNSFTALGDGLLGYEPRYDRCRCDKFWSRTKHALIRNFITYDRTEKSIRPRIPLYMGAFGAGVIEGTWKPANRDLLAEGYRSVITQVGFGCLANFVGEFAPDVLRALKKKSQ